MHFVEGATATSRGAPGGIDIDYLSGLFTEPCIDNNSYSEHLAF